MDYRARYINVEMTNDEGHTQQGSNDLFIQEADYDNIFLELMSNRETSKPDPIHLMDVQMVVFHCADGFLKHLMVTKLSQCQYALPLLVPDPFTQQIEFPLWTFRQINKSWKIRNTNNEIISQTHLVYKAETPMVSFFRFGSVSSSKSHLMNSLINEKHNTFFHRNCPGSSRTRELMDGVVEIAWFCPSGSYDDKFTDCVAFCNLHGDAGDHEKQLQILTEMSSVNVVLLPQLDRNDKRTENDSASTETRKGKFKIGLKDRNQSAVSEELRRVINDCLSESSSTFRLEDVSKHSDIRVDEEDDDDCRRGRGAFMQLVKVSDEMKTQMNFDYILVVDTEGLRALELTGSSTRHHDNELATFDVGLANLTLINIFGENPSEMQDIFQIVVQAFLRMKKVKLNPSCMFVHQNVSDITAGEKNMDGRRRLQETLDKMTKLAAKEEVYDAECFSDVIAFDVQNNVKYFSQFWEGNPPMAPPNPKYCENIQELKKTIMSHASKSHGMRLVDLKYRIKDLWEALLNERFVFSFQNSLEIAVYRKLETEYSKWSWSLRSAMMKTENKLHNKIENEAIHEVEETDLQRELKKTREEVKKSMSEFFEKDVDANILIQWKSFFEIKIQELQETIIRETKRKLNWILQQRDLKKMIDAQKTHHENTLYEKSKELALKLKDKTTDEQTLKKEFDIFWKQCVKKIIRDTPLINDIHIMRYVKHFLSDIYESAPVGESSECRDVFSVPSYSDYVQLKKSSGFTGHMKNAIKAVKENIGYILSQEDEAQIRALVSDVAQQIEKRIILFNIAKMGYNISCIQQLTDYIKIRVRQHQEGQVKYVFKNEFFINFVYSIFKRANKTLILQHRMFREDNDPVLWRRRKKSTIVFSRNTSTEQHRLPFWVRSSVIN
ncbi:hypothetical protein ABG768_020398 [Culter alburnus]|uniref:VLIG-type G domain-containing protein n=1 Tax=Culter alburnus TaxID=194366 RepID=A0AAW2B1I3_CULAL